ncbi:hypothetical protein B0H13DRAFT_2369823 [Mycena leptocephala]|nr:hypothetical protein B0H13DRAFT_2369823 [Mycena leptocephala]
MTGSEPSAEEGGSGDELELETEEEVGTSAASTSAVGSGAVETTEPAALAPTSPETTETEPTSSTSPPTSTTAAPQPPGTSVNWWRLYRFPAQRPGRGLRSRLRRLLRLRHRARVVEHEHEHGTAATSAYVAASTGTLNRSLTGYYLPEHGILNGADGAFVNFLELPELLGYARPPSASKADIARAGLKVLCRDALPAAEKGGRVEENCVERCLICLDDYAQEDDIRVLSCRHAFHLSCVNRWLETGPNNCPACRTKGVPTSTMSAAAAAAAHAQA